MHGWEPGAPLAPLTPASTPAVEEVPELAEHALPAQADAGGRATATVEPAAPSAETSAPAAPLAPVLSEPEPVALSVLAHGATPADEEPTGSRELDGGVAAPSRHRAPGGPDPEPGKDRPDRGRRRVLLILGAVALLIGATLGLIGSVLRDDDPEENAGTTSTGATDEGEPIPTLSAEPHRHRPAAAGRREPRPGLRLPRPQQRRRDAEAGVERPVRR